LRTSCVHFAEFFVLNIKHSSLVSLRVFVWALVSSTMGSSIATATDAAAQAFFKQYCSACHSGAKPEGSFKVASLSSDFGQTENRKQWLKVAEQLKTGTMPPPAERRPDNGTAKELLDWIDQQIADAENVRRQTHGRAVMRRLNQTEYANTVRDLLQVDVDLEGVLPDDSIAGGFDTAAESLHFSSYLLAGYLKAANRALDAVFANGPRPWVQDLRIDPKTEIATRRKDVYRHLDDGVAVFASDLASNIQIVFWKFLTRFPGKYRFRISAYAYQTDQPVLFHINGGTENLGEPPYLIDYFEVPPGEPTVVEFVAELEARRNIRLLVDTKTRPRDLQRNGGAADYEGPGLVVQWLEVEGPLLDSWPPPSYRLLLGNLPQQPVAGEQERREVVSQQPLKDAERILRAFARRAFRRPATDDEIQLLLGRVRIKWEQGASFERALRVGLKGVLVSPHFLFLRQQVRPVGGGETSRDSQRSGQLDEFSLASRLSYFLWSSMPDEELLRLAQQGELSDPDVLHDQVERLLADEKVKAFTENFAGQWLGLREIDATQPDRQLYPEYDKLLRASMIKEVYLFFDEVLNHDLSLTNFVDSDFSMLNGRLAEHYGVPDVTGLEFRKVSLSQNLHRGGVMTMAAILKVTANGTTTSPIVRGAWVLDALLGTPPPRPPMGVAAVEPDIRGATTIREQLARHRQVDACAICHVLIDPPGFALENFDVIGGWREHYRSIGEGAPVNVQGRRMRYRHGPPVDAADVLSDGRRFDDIDQYKQLILADKDQLARALATKLLTYATGVAPTSADRPEIEAIVEAVRGQSYGFRSLVHEVIQSELFRSK
jgi:mono/diheme cytochrome c family protein